MKKKLLLLLTLILGLNGFSQITFEKGYYINNSDQKIECLIKNMDWKNNPTTFKFMLAENTEQQEATIKTVKEFGIYSASKYIRFNVNIDRSSRNAADFSKTELPVYKEEELFLKVLAEGEANLYQYEDPNFTAYFYTKGNSIIQQLTYKFYVYSDNKVGKNEKFRLQLWNDLKCQNISMNEVKNLSYDKKELVNFFLKYNNCNNPEWVKLKEKKKIDSFNLNLRPGINSSSLSVIRNTADYTSKTEVTDFGNDVTFRLGIEAEFIMPFNKNKWALIIEPTYQYFKAEKSLQYKDVTIDYQSIELPVGIRHYFFLKNNSKIFINGSVILDFTNSKMEYLNSTPGELEMASKVNLGFGIGYKFHNKYSVELRNLSSRELFRTFDAWGTDYKTVSLIFGYTLF